MLKSLLAVVVPVLLAAFVAAQDLTINTPTTGIVQCQPLLISWSGGTPPYFLSRNLTPRRRTPSSQQSLLPGGQPSATPLVDFGRQNGTSLTWTVNQPAGTSLGLTLRDSTGKVAQTAPFTVTASTSPDTSCLTTTTGTGTSRTATGTTTTTAATTPTTAPVTPGTTTKPNTPISPGTSTSVAPTVSPSSTGTAGAWSINNHVARSALVGVVGAAVVAIFA